MSGATAAPRFTNAALRRTVGILWSCCAIAVSLVGLWISRTDLVEQWVPSIVLLVVFTVGSFFWITMSSADNLFTLGISSAALGLAMPVHAETAVFTLWFIGIFVGILVSMRHLALAAEATVGIGVGGLVFVGVWHSTVTLVRAVFPVMGDNGMALPLNSADRPVATLNPSTLSPDSFDVHALAGALGSGLPWIQAATALVATLLVRTLLSTLRMLTLTRLSLAQILASIGWGRWIFAFVLQYVVLIVGTAIAVVLDQGIGLSLEFGTLLIISVLAAGFFGVAGSQRGQVQSRRLAALLTAAEKLPAETTSKAVFERALNIIGIPLRSFDLSVAANVPTCHRDWISSDPIDDAGQLRYLIATRHPIERPFTPGDAQLLDGVAAIVSETLRVQNEIARLRTEANTDKITGLLNYRAFQKRLTDLGRALNPRQILALIYLDVDNFKLINDQYGHEAGNQVLKAVAERMTEVVRPDDVVARVGGDEFVIILVGLTERETAETIATRVTNRVTDPIEAAGRLLAVQASYGISYSEPGQRDLTPLIDQADQRMYAARGRGIAVGSGAIVESRGTHRAHEPGSAATLVAALREAIAEKRLASVYQPVVDTETGTIVAVEALTRYTDATFGVIPIDTIVAEASRQGLLTELSVQVLERAARDMARIRRVQPALRRMHVNIFAEQLLDARFRQALAAVRAEQPGVEFVLEINEKSFRGHPDAERIRAEAQLFVDHEHGLLAADDLGKAHSNLLALVQYPFSVIKVDKAVLNSAETPRGLAVIEQFVLMANHLEVQLVFEGVETSSQLSFLHTAGARYIQGFFFGRPMRIEELLLRFEVTGLAAQVDAAASSR